MRQPPQKILRFLQKVGLWVCSFLQVLKELAIYTVLYLQGIFSFHITMGRAKGMITRLKALTSELVEDLGFSH